MCFFQKVIFSSTTKNDFLEKAQKNRSRFKTFVRSCVFVAIELKVNFMMLLELCQYLHKQKSLIQSNIDIFGVLEPILLLKVLQCIVLIFMKSHDFANTFWMTFADILTEFINMSKRLY